MQDILYVEWDDATTMHGWQEPNNLSLAKIKSFGFLVYEDSKMIAIANSVNDSDGEVNSITCIPKSWITKKIKLDYKI